MRVVAPINVNGGSGMVMERGVHSGVEGDVDFEIFHGRVEIFLDDCGEAMNFIDEQNVTLGELGEDADEVGALGQGGPAGDVDLGVHFVGDDVGQGGLSQSRWSVEKDVFHGFFAAVGGVDGDFQAADQGCLADVLGEILGAEGVVEVVFFFAA